MFKGSMPALVTPIRNGELDLDALKQLVEWHIAEGSAGLVPVGTTGESPTLSHEEHETVVEEVVKAAAGRVPVIAGAGSNNTVEAIRFMRFAEKVGAAAALVVTPYYNKPTQRGLIAHFTALHDCCDLPIIIYNIPPRSVIDMVPATMGELAKLPRIIGVKDATADITRVSKQRETCGKDFVQLSGEDASALGFNAHLDDLPYLEAMSDGDNHYVAQSAITGLSLFGGKQARNILIKLANKYRGTSRGDLMTEMLRQAYRWPPPKPVPAATGKGRDNA